ncbi:MAG: hypothetical protein PHC91_08035 [Eubacteriales bacterium]|nr:hypothetical protein [Eubacteriales bacterium]
MGNSITIAIEIYLVAFVVAVIIAGLIKGMLGVMRRFTPKKEMTEEGK